MEQKKRASDRFKAGRINNVYLVGVEPGTPEHRWAMDNLERNHPDIVHPAPRKFHAFRVRHKFCADRKCSCRKMAEQCKRSGYYYKPQSVYLYCNVNSLSDAIMRDMMLDHRGTNGIPCPLEDRR